MKRANDVLCVRKPLILKHPRPTANLTIRLLNIQSQQFEIFDESTFPPFLVISYAWNGFWDREVSFDDINANSQPTKPGFRLFMAACELALIMDLRYIWGDSFCVDLRSGGGISDALLHMQLAYQRAETCLVFFPGFLRYQANEPSKILGQWRLEHSQPTSSTPTMFEHDSRRQMFILSAVAYRLHFCKSTQSSELPWINRILERAVTGICEIFGEDFGRQLADYGAQPWMNSESGRQSGERETRTPILVTYTEPNMPQNARHAQREEFLLAENNTFASTPSFYGWTSANLHETHLEAIRSAVWDFECHSQDSFGNGSSGSSERKTHQILLGVAAAPYALDRESQLSDSFIPKVGFAHHQNASAESYYPSPQSDVRFPIRTWKEDLGPEPADDWIHVTPECRSNCSKGPPSTHTLSGSDKLGDQEDFLVKQNNQAFVQGGNSSGFPAANLNASDVIRCWLFGGSMASTQHAAIFRDTTAGASIPVNIGGESSRRDIRSVSSRGTSSKQRNRVRCFDEWANSESSLGDGHPLKTVASYIVQKALKQFQTWKETHKYVEERPQDDSAMLAASQNGSMDRTSETGMPTRNIETLELACPYYKKDPKKYANCVKRCCLRTIGDVKDHIWQHHRIPFYCPICKKDFSTASGRDQHIVKRTCVIEDCFPFEGVSDDHRRRLFRRRRGVGVKQQWFQIWKIVLPQVPLPKSAMLKDENGQEIAAFREFWSFHGEGIVAEMVQAANLEAWDKKSEERDLASLFSEVLNGAIDVIFSRLHLV